MHFLRAIRLKRSVLFEQNKIRRGAVAITTAQFHSIKPELRFSAGSCPAQGVSEIRDDENL